MAYTKTNWLDRLVQFPNRFTRSTANGYDTLTPAPGTITQSGTPITSNALNNMENGIANNDSRLTTIEDKYVSSPSGAGLTIDYYTGIFFTNGGSNTATATVSFIQAYSEPPKVSPADISQSVPYSDTLYHPYIYNITTTGFTVKVVAAGPLGTLDNPANMLMNFIVAGK